MEISIPGVGEAPISISGFDDGWMALTIRKVGRLTDQVFELDKGDVLYLRGPYGNGFDLDLFRNRDVAFIAGGTGLAPVHQTINYLITHPDQIKHLDVLVGFKTPKDRLFVDDLNRWSKSANVIVTVDIADEETRSKPGRGKNSGCGWSPYYDEIHHT